MNKDIIYREDAIKAVEDVSENYTKEGDREWHPHIDFITQALVQVPSVPPKRGKWIWDEQILSLVCSECKELGVERSNFCPNCGSRMKGVDDGRNAD